MGWFRSMYSSVQRFRNVTLTIKFVMTKRINTDNESIKILNKNRNRNRPMTSSMFWPKKIVGLIQKFKNLLSS